MTVLRKEATLDQCGPQVDWDRISTLESNNEEAKWQCWVIITAKPSRKEMSHCVYFIIRRAGNQNIWKKPCPQHRHGAFKGLISPLGKACGQFTLSTEGWAQDLLRTCGLGYMSEGFPTNSKQVTLLPLVEYIQQVPIKCSIETLRAEKSPRWCNPILYWVQ